MGHTETFDHAYFVFVDAAGHSDIVQNNARDRAEVGFDLLRAAVDQRVALVAAGTGCGTAKVWQWAGDGGLVMVNDDRESVAVGTALGIAKALLDRDLPHLRTTFLDLPLRGELHLRVSVHKGTMRYRGPGYEGAIYGNAVNLAAHLERAAPADTLVISADVHRVAGDQVEGFRHAGSFGSAEVFLWRPKAVDAVRPWLARHGLAGSTTVHAYSERPSQGEKARLVDAALTEIVEMGIALNTCSNYLVTRERPARYRDAVVDFLARGGRYRCVLTAPDSLAAAEAGRLRHEDVTSRINDSLSKLGRFKNDLPPAAAAGLEVYVIDTYPGLAAFAVDLADADALLIYSPYVTPIGPDLPRHERADMPHYQVSRSAGPLFDLAAGQLLHALGSATRLL